LHHSDEADLSAYTLERLQKDVVALLRQELKFVIPGSDILRVQRVSEAVATARDLGCRDGELSA
jgi:hypothetical protein